MFKITGYATYPQAFPVATKDISGYIRRINYLSASVHQATLQQVYRLQTYSKAANTPSKQ